MFENCSSLYSIDISNFDTQNLYRMDFMFADSSNLSYINFSHLYDAQMDSMLNIFQNTPPNMVVCINPKKAKNLTSQINGKDCSIVDCNSWYENRRIINGKTNKCVDSCKSNELLFDFKCLLNCPEGTYPDDNVCKTLETRNETSEECNLKNFYRTSCLLNLNNDTVKQKHIENTINSLMNLELYDLVYMAKYNEMIYSRSTGTETFQIYALSNKKRGKDNIYIDLNECARILKNKYGLPENEDLIVFKIEYISSDYQIPIAEYNIFGRDGRVKLNLNHCKNLKIKYLIPKKINNYVEYLYNPNSQYYTDKCFSSTSEDNTDLILYDRKNNFNLNNLSLCESMCTFKGYLNNEIICECEVKLKFNSYLNFNSDKYNLIYRFDDNKLKASFNIWVIKCIYKSFDLESLLSNTIFLVILAIICIMLIGAIIFFVFEKKHFFGKIQLLINAMPETSETEDNDDFEEKDEYDGNDNKDENQEENGMSKKQLIFNLNKKIGKIKKKSKKEKTEKLEKKEKKGKVKVDKKQISEKLSKLETLNEKDASKVQLKGDDKFYNLLKIKRTIKNRKNPIKGNQTGILKSTDNELNKMYFREAILYDKRSFFNYFCSLMRTKNLLFFAFIIRNDFNARTIKICFLFLIFGINLTINLLFIDESSLHEFYISKGQLNIIKHLSKILYASLASLFIKSILLSTIFTEKNFLKIKKRILVGKLGKGKETLAISVKSLSFFPISIMVLLLSCFYVICFGVVYKNSHINILIISVISFLIQLIVSIVFYIVPSIIRLHSLKSKRNKECLYRFSQLLQFI